MAKIMEFMGLASVYDLIYADKDYSKDCAYVDKLVRRYGNSQNKLLDIACGTGNQTIEFKKNYYNVQGLDISPEMIKIAKKKAKNIPFYCCAIQNMDNHIKETFDTITCLFNAFGYIIKDDDIQKSFNNIYKMLNKGGVFIFDVRNGIPSVSKHEPITIKETQIGKYRTIKQSSHIVDKLSNIFISSHQFYLIKKNKIIKHILETHIVRYYFPAELRYILKKTGFESVMMFPYLQFGSINADTWQIMVVAKK